MSDIFSSPGGAPTDAAVHQLAAQFGLRPDEASAAISALMPEVAAGLKDNLATETGAAKLTSELATGRHEPFIDQPEVLAKPETALEGNAILGHIFGNKEKSSQVANGAAQKTGIDPEILKKMLPIIAAMVMGGLAKRSKTPGTGTGGPSGIGGILSSILDRNKDGSAMDDVGGMLGGLLGKKGGVNT